MTKITLNMGVGEAKTDAKALDAAIEELTTSPASARRCAGAQVDRELQAPRGDGRRREGNAARRPHVRVPRPARLDRAAAHPRLPRAQPGLVRRARQLLARRPRADHLPRDRLRRRRVDPRPRRHDHDARRRRTSRRSRCCAASGSRSRPREGISSAWPRSPSSSSRAAAKYKTRATTRRCNKCGRPRAVFKKFGLCRICLRELAHKGAIPGMTKSSW